MPIENAVCMTNDADMTVIVHRKQPALAANALIHVMQHNLVEVGVLP